MSVTLNEQWFVEPCEEHGSAFALKIKEKLHHEKTPYQEIDIYATEQFGHLMTIDSFVMLTERDNFLYHEMMSHTALFTHRNPKKVVVIGGGDCGTTKEILKHQSVEEVWQIEIDEQVTRLSEKYFPSLCESNNDPRANFYFGDGIAWMDSVEQESIDVIIIDSADPVGPGEGLFQAPFYASCHKALRQGGLIIHQSESPLYQL